MIDWEKAGREILAQQTDQAEIDAAEIDALEAFLRPVILYNAVNRSSLDKQWQAQASRLADLFASPLGRSRDEYMEGLPRFSEQPYGCRGRFEIQLLVQTPTRKLDLVRMLALTGVTNYLEPKNVKDWQEDSGKFRTPDAPYVTWVNDGSKNLNRSVQDVRNNLASDERGGTVFDGLALFIQKPNILKAQYLDLPGSQVGSGRAPSLNLWHGQPRLGAGFVDVADPEWGSVVAGRQIVT